MHAHLPLPASACQKRLRPEKGDRLRITISQEIGEGDRMHLYRVGILRRTRQQLLDQGEKVHPGYWYHCRGWPWCHCRGWPWCHCRGWRLSVLSLVITRATNQ